MPITKIGINVTALQNITTPTFDIKNTTEEFINDIPVKANDITGGYYGIIVLSLTWLFLMWKLQESEITGGDFGYDNVRSAGIASAICAVIGIFMLAFGYFANFYHVVIFIVATFILTGLVWKSSQ